MDLNSAVDSVWRSGQRSPDWESLYALLNQLDEDSKNLLEAVATKAGLTGDKGLAVGKQVGVGTHGPQAEHERRSAGQDSQCIALWLAVLSEHFVDKLLLLPGEMRERDLMRLADQAGVTLGVLRRFDRAWHERGATEAED